MTDSAIKKRLQRARARVEAIMEQSGYEILIVRGKSWDFEARRKSEARRILVCLDYPPARHEGIEIALRMKSGKIKFLPMEEKP